jgi:hypothetical protein
MQKRLSSAFVARVLCFSCLVLALEITGCAGTPASEQQAEPAFTHVIATDTAYYLTGPQQASPPDGTFKAGTKVWLLREAGSYVRVRAENGTEAYVSRDSLAALSK